MMVLDALKEHDAYQCYLNEDYDHEQYANTVIAASTVTQTLNALKVGVEKLDAALEEHVSEHYEDLIDQATGIDILEESLSIVKSRVGQLQRSVNSVRKRISEPYHSISSRTAQLGRLQRTCDVLRRVTRIQYLVRRLRQQVESKEVAKTAQSLNELEYLYGEEGDLRGINAVERDLEWVQAARRETERSADQILSTGLTALNQNQTSTALQVYSCLGLLQGKVRALVEERCEAVGTELEVVLAGNYECLSHGGSAPGGAASFGNTPAWRATFWSSLDRWCEGVTGSYSKLQVLHRTLARRRDPLTGRSLLEECEVTPLESYVTRVHGVLQSQLRGVGSAVRQALNAEYPKILRVVAGMWAHFRDKAAVEGLEGVTLPRDDPRDILAAFQGAYLARSLNRLLDPVNLAFPGKGAVPSPAEIEGIVRCIVSEISAARGDTELKNLSVSNAVKAVRDILTRCESLVHHGSGVRDISGAPNQYHSRNIAVLNLLCTLHSRLGEVPAELRAAEVWLMVREVTNTLLAPFRLQLEQILGIIHDADYSMGTGSIAGCSDYISLVEETITHLTGTYLTGLTGARTVLRPLLAEFQASLLALYLRHLAVVRPLGEGGKMRLATDMAEMERVLTSLSAEKTPTAETFRDLRAFRSALFMTTSDLVGVRNVRRELLLNHLFSRAEPSLPSPHKVAGWTAAQYVSWLDSHRPEEAVEMVQGAIQWYEDMVRESGAPAFDPVYPTIIALLS